MKQQLSGILSAIVTPFNQGGSSVDEGRYAELIRSQIDAGIHGVVASGSTGEHPALSLSERRRLFEIAVQTASSQIDVIAHVGSSNLRDSLELARHARSLGVDQMLVLTPYFDRLAFDDVRRFLNQVVEIAGGAIIYYDTPGITGLHISEQQMVTLKAEGLVSHVKDSPQSFARTMRLLSNPDAPTVLAGSDPALLAALMHGAPGSIIGASTFVPELCVALYEAVRVHRDYPQALAIWDKLWPILDFMLQNGYVPLAKAGSAARGLDVGEPREPVRASEPALKARFAQLLEQLGVQPLALGA
ncbi:dihydrodipicolinate synthase family protein [Pseudomonas sp. S31]|uniref:dihydrodipicolinate synthase family protein n=1 Tax=Pseudomonas sp. S31 TaxID=1564473 RepID=UPI00191135E9|nr:dihydrodipicolinate synthase family protein [Pseudomonas sp. S31]MBK5000214.1 dihydrodipicolinate synthase family protein [Pseudomonas sp. S31]